MGHKEDAGGDYGRYREVRERDPEFDRKKTVRDETIHSLGWYPARRYAWKRNHFIPILKLPPGCLFLTTVRDTY